MLGPHRQFEALWAVGAMRAAALGRNGNDKMLLARVIAA